MSADPAGLDRRCAGKRGSGRSSVDIASKSQGKISGMEPFVFSVWLWMGLRFEQAQILNMGRSECIDRLLTIQGDRDLAKCQCIGANGYILPTDRPIQICAFAGGATG